MDPIIEDYKLKFCGMFSFTSKQRKQLSKRPIYKPFETHAAVVQIINNQYYPAFRPIITNISKESSHLELVSVNPVPFTNCQFVNYGQNSMAVASPTFCVQNIALTFYDDRFGVGIYSFEIKCVDPATNQTQLHFNKLTAFALFARDFDHKIQIGSEIMTMAQFIENKLLTLDDKGNTIKIKDTSGDPYFSGPKMKTWVAIDLPGKTENEYKQALYELGTCGQYGTAVSGDLYSASQSYYNEKIADQLSVFNNWTALCLWDSFSMIGNGYNGNSFDVWNDTYFKVYKYNLYYKFYLFKINSDLSIRGRLGVTRKELLSFINKYDQEVISYNFLPNLLFQHMKKALDSKAESEALLAKIESSNTLLQEHSALFLNWFLGIIAFLSLVSILGDANDLYDKLYGVKNPDPKIVSSNTWLTLYMLVGAISLLPLIYWFKRYIQRRRHL
jgi:hypothetical protein